MDWEVLGDGSFGCPTWMLDKAYRIPRDTCSHTMQDGNLASNLVTHET